MKPLKKGEDLSKTHTIFFPLAIQAATEKAFYIRVFNKKGGLCYVWVPISRIRFEPLEDKIKYYAPNFFIK